MTGATPLSVLQFVTCSAIYAAGRELAPPGAGGLQGLSLFSDDLLRLLAEELSGLANRGSQVQASLPMLSKATGLHLSSRAHGSATSQAMRQQGQQRLLLATPAAQCLPAGQQLQVLPLQQVHSSGGLLPRKSSVGDLLLLAQWQQQQQRQQPSAEMPLSRPVCEQQQQQQQQWLVEAVAAASGMQPAMQQPNHLQSQQRSQLLRSLDKPLHQASATSTASVGTTTPTSTAHPSTSPADARATSRAAGSHRSASKLGSTSGETRALMAEATTLLGRLSESHFGCTPSQLPESLRVKLIDQLLYGS